MNSPANLETISRYFTSVEKGNAADIAADLFSHGSVLEILPNRLFPNGTKSGIIGLLQMCRRLISSQSFDVKSCVADGDRVWVEFVWSGTLAVPFDSLAAGSQMRGHCAIIFEFDDGRIAYQRMYECFEPW